ncbi:MAG: hypothetical protein Q4D56_08020 [Bacteroides sp.]|nr:hypothetical protein [Bacteroides sp.]
MKKNILYFLGSLCCLIVAIYAYSQDFSKLLTGAGCMGCWLLGMGIGRFLTYKKNIQIPMAKWKWISLVTALAFLSLFIVYVLFK